MKEIPLKHGKVLLVDDADFEWLSQFRWNLVPSRGYVTAWVPKKERVMTLHHLLIPRRKGRVVDHINGNRLDNRRCNLRSIIPIHNCWNQGKRQSSRNTSQYKGVSWHSRDKMWRVRVQANGTLIVQKYFEDEIEAARYYDAVARATFGQYARLNFPESSVVERTAQPMPLPGMQELDRAA